MAVAARTVAAAHQAHTAAAAHQARTAAAAAHQATAVVVHTQAAQVAAAQPFLHFCGSAFYEDQVCDLASRCATVQAAPLHSASSSLVCTTAGAAS